MRLLYLIVTISVMGNRSKWSWSETTAPWKERGLLVVVALPALSLFIRCGSSSIIFNAV